MRSFRTREAAIASLDLRRERGLLLAPLVISLGNGCYRVPSASGGDPYDVDLKAETCTCPDWRSLNEERDRDLPYRCKHVWAAVLFRGQVREKETSQVA